MNNIVFLYIKYQYKYLFFLLVLTVMPLALFFKFSPYSLPKIQYVILGYLFMNHYFFFKEYKFRKKNEKNILIKMRKELKRTPSYSEINSRLNFICSSRVVSIFIAASLILVVMVYFKQF